MRRWLAVWWLVAAACAQSTGELDRGPVSAPDPPHAAGPAAPRRAGSGARSGPSAEAPRKSDFVAESPRAPDEAERARYAFLPAEASIRALDRTVPAPPGFRRVETGAGSFGAWLRGLPLRPPRTSVRAFDGRELLGPGDGRVFAVAELDVSPVDVQQCADSVIRLHAEWLWSRGDKAKIGYHFLSGDFATYARYASGERPQVDGPRVRWAQSASASDDRTTFRKYLDMVFNYASTISLAQRTTKIDRAVLGPGDFFVLPGGPGHAILILDVAIDDRGRKVALLGQGFMPAQDFHVLASREEGLSPWFSLDGDAVDTPFWPEPFPWTSLRRFGAGG
jgi:hypothetical protein